MNGGHLTERSKWLLGGERMTGVLANIEQRCHYATKATGSVRVEGKQAEAVIADALRDAKLKLDHDISKHTLGSDIFPLFRSRRIDGISAKTGIRKNHRGASNYLMISGYRLGRFGNDLDSALAWIAENKPSSFLCLANPVPVKMTEARVFTDFHLYSVFSFEGHLLDYGTPEMWYPSSSGKRFLLDTPFLKAEIRPSMAWQLWTYVDVNALGIQPIHSFAVQRTKRLSRPLPTEEQFTNAMNWGAEGGSSAMGSLGAAPKQLALALY